MKRFISIIMAATIVFSSMSATALDVSAATETARTSTSDTATKRTGKKLTYDEAYERLKPLFEDDASTTTTTKPATSVNGKLPAPTGLTAEKTSTKIVIKWDEVDGADAYRVYMRNSKTGKYEKYKTVKGEQCTVTDIQNNKEYKFIVAALDVVNGKYVAGTNSAAVTASKPGTTTTKPGTTTTKPGTTTQQQSGDYIKMTDFWGNELSSSMRVRRNSLSKDQKYLYDTILKAVASGKTTVTFDKSYSANDIEIANSAVVLENPYLIWADGAFFGSYSNGGYSSLRFEYHSEFVKDKAGALQRMDDYLKPALTKASKMSSDIDKVKFIHDWLIYYCNDSSVTNNPDDQYYHEAYSAIVDKKGVCQAYSHAFLYAMQKLGIQATCLHGTTWSGEQHVWNMVKVGGDWYEIDVYWDDIISKSEKDYDYTCFMQTTASLKAYDSYNGVSRKRSNNSGSNLLPTAKGTKYSPSNYNYSVGSNFKDLAKVVLTKKANGSSGNAAQIYGASGNATKKTLPTGWYKYSPVVKRLNVSSLKESSWTQDGDFYIVQQRGYNPKTKKNDGTIKLNTYVIYDAAYDNYYIWSSNGKTIQWYNYSKGSWETLK